MKPLLFEHEENELVIHRIKYGNKTKSLTLPSSLMFRHYLSSSTPCVYQVLMSRDPERLRLASCVTSLPHIIPRDIFISSHVSDLSPHRDRKQN